MLAPVPKIVRRFQLVLIKPSHYDDDGYVIQWLRSAIPSNSLAALYSLRADCRRARRCSGRRRRSTSPPSTRPTPASTSRSSSALIAPARRPAWSALVGVQSNQFPRALDIARPLRAAGIPVVIGGFHVSGCLAMLPEMQADLQAALDMGCQPVRRRGGRPHRRACCATPPPGTLQADLQLHGRSAGARRTRRRRILPRATIGRTDRRITRASMPAAAVRSSARSAPSSTCRAASRAAARPTTSSS